MPLTVQVGPRPFMWIERQVMFLAPPEQSEPTASRTYSSVSSSHAQAGIDNADNYSSAHVTLNPSGNPSGTGRIN